MSLVGIHSISQRDPEVDHFSFLPACTFRVKVYTENPPEKVSLPQEHHPLL